MVLVIQAVKGFPTNYGPQSISALFKRALSKSTCNVSEQLSFFSENLLVAPTKYQTLGLSLID